jgi:hypothetical protein
MVTTLDLTKTTEVQEVTTGQPVIKGYAAPNAKITVVINSETQINYELVADANGGFTIDVSKLENDPTLEPGEHTITYSYVDPQTGKEVTKTQTFMVKAPATSTTSNTSSTSQQLALANTNVPYGSGNPVSILSSNSAQTSTSSTKTSTSSGTKVSTSSGRTSLPSTASGIPRSGNVETTLALIIGGLFFIAAGTWSYWAAQEIEAI